jgi:two-component system, NtrC family, sensor histidine kinase HydH
MGDRTAAPSSTAAAASTWWRAGLVLALSALISVAHAATSTHYAGLHAFYEFLYYVPILMAAYWFGAPGGLLAAVLCSALYVPHIQTSWSDNPPYAASQYGQLVAFHLVGGIVGLLIGRLRRASEDARAAANALAATNRELMESHQHLTRAERLSALGTLAAGLAHEVRTPIAAIKGALDILASRARPDTPEAEFTALAVRELSRLGTLLEDFLAYARPRPPERVPVRLPELVDRVQALLVTEAHGRDVTTRVHVEGTGELTADPAQLTQVLLNLVLNAIQATPAGGHVEIAVRDEPEAVDVTITDQGPGIPSEVAERMFEPFFTTKSKGTGLGLPIAQRIVAAHGGTLEVAPTGSTGTRVTIRLPRQPGAAMETAR